MSNISAKVMDWTIVAIFGCTYGIVLEPSPGAYAVCPPVGTGMHSDSPFKDDMVVGLGYCVVLVLITPLGYFNLDDNIKVQVICFVLQNIIFAWWIVAFLARGFVANAAPAFGPPMFNGAMLGQIMVNYAAVMTIPSWVNEKHPSSSPNRGVWSAVIYSTLLYLLVGLMGAFSFACLDGADILSAIARAHGNSIFDQISVYLFPLIVVASSIPIYSIIIRYNLIENHICSTRWANFWAVVFPWLLVIPLTAGNNVFNQVVAITSILFQIPINLIVPFVIYLLARRRYKALQLSKAQQIQDPPVSSLLSINMAWAVRYPRMSRICGRRFTAWMDAPYELAPEHFAFPSHWPERLVRGIAYGFVIASAVFMLVALGVGVSLLIDPLESMNCTLLPANTSGI